MRYLALIPRVGSRQRTRGGEQFFLKLIALANRNKCEIKLIGLAKTTPLYLLLQAPKQLTNQATKMSGQKAHLNKSRLQGHKNLSNQYSNQTGELLNKLVMQSVRILSSLVMLNSKATLAKLKSSITQLHKLSNVTSKATQANQLLTRATSMQHKQEDNQQTTQASKQKPKAT